MQFAQSAASILIVDDHDGFRTFARGMLEAAGFTVAEAATGAEAAEAARSVRPGLVLLDIQLPDFDGFEVARRLAAQAGGSAQAGGPVIVLTSTRDASDYGGRISSSPAAGFLPKDELSGAALRRFLAAPWPAGPDMSRRALAWLIAGAAAATACYFLVARPPGNASYLVFYLGTPAVAVAFLAAGLAAWLRWPGSRLGLLFSLVGYFTLLPALDYLNNSAGFTIGNAAVSLAGATLAHLGLAWPTGRLRSRFERGVVVAEYASIASLSAYWGSCLGPGVQRLRRDLPGEPAAGTRLPASLGRRQHAERRSRRRAHRHRRGPDHQALAVGARLVPAGHGAAGVDRPGNRRGVRGHRRRRSLPPPPLANLVFNGWAPLAYMLGPVLFVISTVRARTARGALGTAIVDLEPGAPPGRLRDTLARALGDSTLHWPSGTETASPTPRAWRWTRSGPIPAGL